MKRLFTLVLAFGVFAGHAQFVENFSYTAGAALTDNNWVVTAANTTNPVSVVSPGLTYTGYAGSGVGNAVALANNGQDVYRELGASASSGSIYASFLINVSAAQATGDYFFAFTTATSPTTYSARTFIKSSGTGFQLGISKSTETAIYGTTDYTFNTTYLVVAKYTFATGSSTDDQVALYVFSSGIPTTEPATPTVGPTTSTTADNSNNARIVLRQGSTTQAATLTIDAFRVSDGWYNSPMPASLKNFSAYLINNKPSLSWSTTNEINVNGFSIEKSADGRTFSEVGFVKANNTTSNQYSFNDAVAIAGTTYFRLKMVDKDGSFKYSQTLVLNNKKAIKLEVYPNPVKDMATVSHTQAVGNAAIKLVTVDGRTLATYTVQTGATQTSLDLSKLTKGSYMLVFENEGSRTVSQLIKQ